VLWHSTVEQIRPVAKKSRRTRGPDAFYSAKLGITRTKEHNDDLEPKVAEFFLIIHAVASPTPDNDGTYQIYKFEITKRFCSDGAFWRLRLHSRD
jgi:hypothetical protein